VKVTRSALLTPTRRPSRRALLLTTENPRVVDKPRGLTEDNLAATIEGNETVFVEDSGADAPGAS
jgi:hypothetical protein